MSDRSNGSDGEEEQSGGERHQSGDGGQDQSGDGGQDQSGNGGSGSRWAERLLTAVSVAFTILLLSFVLWQASTTPVGAEPTASVAETETLADGEVKVAVSFRNPQGVGLVTATAEVDCATPPPDLTFEHVPTDDRRTGYVICPSGTEAPNATVSSWVEA